MAQELLVGNHKAKESTLDLRVSGRSMAGHVLLAVDESRRCSLDTVNLDVQRLSASIAFHLRCGGTKYPTATYSFGARSADRLSGEIFLSLTPKQLKFLILDARVSIVLARQRHLDDEQYRRRLA